jgi:type I restriction enzyme S subunit
VSGWRTATVAEIASDDDYSVVGGPFGSSLGRKDYVDAGVPVIRGAQLSGPAHFHDEDLVFVSEEKADRHRGNLAYRCDVIVTQVGTVGQIGRIPEDANFDRYLLSQNHIKIRVDESDADSRFVLYALLGPEAQRQIYGSTIAAGVPHINLKKLRSLKLQWPPIETQRAIAAVLGSLDDLIENNRRRIEVLEEMAQAVYQEWFVHFRYPGHEGAAFVDSPLGPIPEGWEPSTCGDELAVLGGGTPSKKEPSYWSDAEVPWYTPSDLTKTRSRFAAPPGLCINELGLSKSSAKRFPAGSVMMTSRATLGVLSIAPTEATTNQGFIVILPDDRWPSSYIYEWLDDNAERLEAVATGATFKEITKGAFKKISFLVPGGETLSAFRSATEPIDGQINTLLQESVVLTELRDLLLPKLVTGEIDVSKLDLDALIEAAS